MNEHEPNTVGREAPTAAGPDDQEIRAIVGRLSRRHPSGGTVIEHAAILAEGADSSAVIAWIMAHAGEPEAAVTPARRGLHSPRLSEATAGEHRPPRRYVLPADPR